MVFKRVSWVMTLAALVWAVPASAQQPRAEISLLVGWVLSDGVDGESRGDGRRRNLRPDRPEGLRQVGPDGWRAARRLRQRGSRVHVWPADEYRWRSAAPPTFEVGDWTINNYHGYFAYNFFEDDAIVRPYILGGLGATSFGSVDYTRPQRRTGTVDGETQFSTTWGTGVKFYAGNVGARIGLQWTPTYIKSDAAGWWCDPWYGCYLVGDPQYANQFEISGGILFRF